MINKQDPASLTRALIDGARTSTLIEEGREKKLTDSEIAAAVFADLDDKDYEALDQLLLVMSTLTQLQEKFGLSQDEDQAYQGLKDIHQHRLNTPRAIAVEEILHHGKTEIDIGRCFHLLNAIPEE